ncbi:MAG TPA: FAD-binding oxidoreductase, partial [Anaerolineales bacterium]|nr:FAD-binding oxidoreductase [Anaerolineales bacterium]
EFPPLSLTSAVGTEAYRNWWPGPGDTMVRFMNRSIDLLEELAEESNNVFQMNRRGYAFLTANPDQVSVWKEAAAEVSALGAGPVREHPGPVSYIPFQAEGFDKTLNGADLVLDPVMIREQFPFITDKVIAMLYVRRCGWINNKLLGNWLFEQAVEHGVRFKQDKVIVITAPNGRVQCIRLASGGTIETHRFVIAAGPFLRPVAALLGLDIPVFNELHGKITFKDWLRVISRPAPFMFWSDPVSIPWTAEERAHWASNPDTRWLLNEFPSGVQFRQRGEDLIALWTYEVQTKELIWPPTFDPHYPEIVLRGLSAMVPEMKNYFGEKVYVDGGYYCKTRENRPLIGPLPVESAYVIGALSGYGVMAAQAAAELVSAYIADAPLPDYAPMFRLDRYEDFEYQKLLENWDAKSGQL